MILQSGAGNQGAQERHTNLGASSSTQRYTPAATKGTTVTCSGRWLDASSNKGAQLSWRSPSRMSRPEGGAPARVRTQQPLRLEGTGPNSSQQASSLAVPKTSAAGPSPSEPFQEPAVVSVSFKTQRSDKQPWAVRFFQKLHPTTWVWEGPSLPWAHFDHSETLAASGLGVGNHRPGMTPRHWLSKESP